MDPSEVIGFKQNSKSYKNQNSIITTVFCYYRNDRPLYHFSSKSVREGRQVQQLYLFVRTWRTPFFWASPGSAGAVLCSMSRCSSSSVPASTALVMGLPGCSSTSSVPSSAQAEAIPFLTCFTATFGVAQCDFLLCGPETEGAMSW